MTGIINGNKPQPPEEPKAMPVLFIGGPHDGKRIGMEALPSVIDVPYTQQAGIITPDNPDAAAVMTMKKARYRREAMRCPAGLYPLYVFSEIPAEDVVWALLEGYREAEEDRPTTH